MVMVLAGVCATVVEVTVGCGCGVSVLREEELQRWREKKQGEE